MKCAADGIPKKNGTIPKRILKAAPLQRDKGCMGAHGRFVIAGRVVESGGAEWTGNLWCATCFGNCESHSSSLQ